METKDYDHVRNLTLLFFLDRLMDKGQPRTLHDLSCQFGTKGFTKEMRQIAGGSQSGLRKFLQQYPSLFTLEGDYVTVTNYSNGIHNPNDPTGKLLGKRDYAKEAVEYFVGKLRQYGAGTEVPIKSLLGHRSQASPEVRHVSGQHVKEFREFLCKYSDTFVVREEAVILKEHEGMAPQPFKELDLPKVDPALTNQLLQYCTSALAKGPVILETLFNGVHKAFDSDLGGMAQICRTSLDLVTFLKMHSNTFTVQANMVRLVQPPPAVAHTHTPPTSSSAAPPPTPPPLPTTAATTTMHQVHTQVLPQQQQQHELERPPPPPPPATAPPAAQQQQQQTVPVTPREDDTPTSPVTSPPGRPQHHQQPNQQTLKARVNTLLRKTLADNSERDRIAYHQYNNVSGGGGGGCGNSENGENVTMRLVRNTRVVVSLRECRQLVNTLMGARQPVSFDGEGVNLGPSGPMTLLQLGLVSGHIYIFDLMVERNLMFEGGLKELLEAPDIVKVRQPLVQGKIIIEINPNGGGLGAKAGTGGGECIGDDDNHNSFIHSSIIITVAAVITRVIF
ncbi:uncharacterized protein LOC143018417 [Oratosquilla oratoria]|uniref:uncharacterized protein LOC143018417 n=1 Tax=Oratosquilla oratoria TaxID=337810 RepID=UPI003F775A64